MLTELFPKAHGRFLLLPVLGGVVDGFAQWLFKNGYSRASVRQSVRCSRRLDRALKRRACPHLTDVTPEVLSACVTARVRKNDAKLAAAVGHWYQYLRECGFLVAPLEPSSRSRALLAAYGHYLRDVRGFAAPTVTTHLRSIAEFLQQLDYDVSTARMTALSSRDIEEFLQKVRRRQARATLQHTVAHLRGFLRFLVAQGELRLGLDTEIDTPRVYRLEQLPRALSWDTVQAFLRSIDRQSLTGRRDYAMLLLIATYGLRAHEVATLTLDAIEWRAGSIRIFPRKGGHSLLLPLTDEVGAALADYLRHGRPHLACREVFLRCRAPAGPIERTAVTDAFQAWSRRSGLQISFQGVHCLRHSYAVHLLRQGVPLKTIGDVLGHRSPEATRVYLRLSTDDLRSVALPLPRADAAVSSAVRSQEVTPWASKPYSSRCSDRPSPVFSP